MSRPPVDPRSPARPPNLRVNRTPRPELAYPNPTQAHLPTGEDKRCGDLLFVDIDGQRHVFACEIQELPGEHPGQPHMRRIIPAEPGDDIFIGWWHAETDPPTPTGAGGTVR